ncbi:MAG TPA: hypothetical protein VLE48_11980, partial [Terriglobales bacterium]|nr:hypothetical protein [Terriglobales bacterium]
MSRFHLISSAILGTSLVAFTVAGCNKKEAPPAQEARETSPPQTPAVKPAAQEDPQVLSEFRKRVDDYVKLRKRVDDSVPPLKPKRTAEQIAEHEQALAGKLR